MKKRIGKALSLMLALVMLTGLLCIPASASEPGVTSVEASYVYGSVSVNGTVHSGVLAVAVMILKDNMLIRLETTGIENNAFDTTIDIILPPGTYTVRAADYEGGPYLDTEFTVEAPPAVIPGTSDSSSYYAGTSGGDRLAVQVDDEAGSALVDLSTIAGSLSGGGNAEVTLPAIPGASLYTVSLPASALSGSSGGSLTVNTGVGSVGIPDGMLSGTGLTGEAEITIGTGNTADLPEEVRQAIGGRPVISLSLSIDGRQTAWNNPNAPVTVSIPYTPTESELENPESIVVWYIDGSGNVVSIPNGRYDPLTGTVVFQTTHFSSFAVVYMPLRFDDVPEGIWFEKAVSFIAARNITRGIGGGKFGPDAKLTRGEFIVLLMRAYDITPDENPADNFTDAGDTYYSNYLAAAKRLGITKGAGGNRFLPDAEITRQEMFTLLYNALNALDKLPAAGDPVRTLSDFADESEISSWAREAVSFLVETGLVQGSNDKLTPLGSSTRAEMAQMLYNLLNR